MLEHRVVSGAGVSDTLRDILDDKRACSAGVEALGSVLDLDGPPPPATLWTLAVLSSVPATRRYVGWAVGRLVPASVLRGADLRSADLWSADLRGADLQHACLQGARGLL